MRLLLRPAELTAGQRRLYDAFEAMTWGEEYQGFAVKNAEGAFVGPWGVMLHLPDLAVPLGQFINLAQRLPGLSERALQAVIVTIGGRFNVAYELYAHAPLAARRPAPGSDRGPERRCAPGRPGRGRLAGRRCRYRAHPRRRGARAAV